MRPRSVEWLHPKNLHIASGSVPVPRLPRGTWPRRRAGADRRPEISDRIGSITGSSLGGASPATGAAPDDPGVDNGPEAGGREVVSGTRPPRQQPVHLGVPEPEGLLLVETRKSATFSGGIRGGGLGRLTQRSQLPAPKCQGRGSGGRDQPPAPVAGHREVGPATNRARTSVTRAAG